MSATTQEQYKWRYFSDLPLDVQRRVACAIVDQTNISFMWEGVSITNPTVDETMRFEVDPVVYYGGAFLRSDFCQPTLGDVVPIPFAIEEQEDEV